MKEKILKYTVLILGVGLFFGPAHVSAQTKSESPRRFRVVVTDEKRRYVSGLGPENFRVTENGVEQSIAEVRTDDAPASVLLLMDVSRSVPRDARQTNAKHALRFIRDAGPGHEYAVVAFDGQVAELAGWDSDFARLEDALTKVFHHKDVSGATAFNDALLGGLEKLKTAKNDKKIILLFSDGYDSASREKTRRMLEAVRRADVVVYPIRLDLRPGESLGDWGGAPELAELARFSGGDAFSPRTEAGLSDVMKRLAVELKSFYLVGYVPPADARKEWRRVKVEAFASPGKKSKQKLVVSAREGYYRDDR